MPDDGRLTAELAAIKERRDVGIASVVPGVIGPADPIEQIRALTTLADVDVPRLVKALEAVLKLAADWEATAAELDRDAIRGRKSNYESDHVQCDRDQEIAREYREHAGELREAIARELTGEGSGND